MGAWTLLVAGLAVIGVIFYITRRTEKKRAAPRTGGSTGGSGGGSGPGPPPLDDR